MWHIYLIQNDITLEKYIGITNNLDRRINEHNKGQSKATNRLDGTWILIYAELYRSKEDAILRERKMKLYGKSKQELFKRCSKSLLPQPSHIP